METMVFGDLDSLEQAVFLAIARVPCFSQAPTGFSRRFDVVAVLRHQRHKKVQVTAAKQVPLRMSLIQ